MVGMTLNDNVGICRTGERAVAMRKKDVFIESAKLHYCVKSGEKRGSITIPIDIIKMMFERFQILFYGNQ